MCNITCLFEAVLDIIKWIYKERYPLLRWIVFGFSLLQCASGIYICGVTSYYISRYFKFFRDADSKDFDPVFGILGTGIYLIIFSIIFGTIGAYKKNIILLSLFALTTLAFLFAVIILYLLVLHEPSITKELFNRLVRSLKLLYKSKELGFYSEVNRFQRQHKCCGVYSFNDYNEEENGEIPQSCCINSLQCDSSNGFKIYTRGCLTAVTEKLHESAPLLEFIGRVVMILLSISILFTLLYTVMKRRKNKRKRNDENPAKGRISLIEVESESELAFYNYNLGHSNSYIIV